MRSRKRICILSPTLSGNAFGRAAVLAELLTSDFDVNIVAFSDSTEMWTPVDVPCHTFYADTMRSLKRELVSVQDRVRDADVLLAVKPLLQSFGIGLQLRKQLRLPLIVDVDDFELGYLFGSLYWEARHHRLGWFTKPSSPLHTRLLDKRIVSADGVTVSNSFLHERYGGVWIPHARDQRRMAAAEPGWGSVDPSITSGRTALFLGSPRKHKGLDDLLKAWRLLDDQHAHLLIVGCDAGDEYVTQLQRLAPSRVLFLPRVTLACAYGMMKKADVFVIPQSRSDASSGQLPMKLLDAMGCSALIVASSVGDIPRWLHDDAGILFQPGNPSDMASAIKTAFESGKTGVRMKTNARRRFEAFATLEAVRPRLIRLVNDLLSGRQAYPYPVSLDAVVSR